MINIDKVFTQISKKEESVGWDNLTKEEKIFVDVMLLSYEVGNGGLYQYYSNPTGDSSLLIPNYLNIIGAKQLSEKMDKINYFFGKNGPNQNIKKRQRELKRLSKEQIDMMDEFDSLVYDGPEDIELLLIDYVQKNKITELVKGYD